MRVFVSSTVFDLIDVRAEVASQLHSMGIIPVMSDDKLSDFKVLPHEDSIETCLVNLDSCDEVIVILDRRYGPRLGKCGFDDVSATHLEYRRARESKKPIHLFVRDRTEADFGISKKNKKSSLSLNWVEDKDLGIFEVLNEHRTLQANSKRSNWYDTFTSSIDLKAAIAKRFNARILPQRLVDAVQRNEFPLIDMDCTHTIDNSCHGVTVFLKNVGGAPAFCCECEWEESRHIDPETIILAPGEQIQMHHSFGPSGGEKFFNLRYESPIGVSVHDRYRVVFLVVGSEITDSNFTVGCERIEHRYLRSQGLRLEIEGFEEED